MIVPSSNLQRGTPRGLFLRRLLGVVLLIATVWWVWVYQQIAAVANQDNAQPADAIAVFGAAEYSGHPSPVLHARLDHAVELYRKQIAPLIITLTADRLRADLLVGQDWHVSCPLGACQGPPCRCA